MLFPLTPRDQDSGARCVRERRIPPRPSLTFPHRGREPGSFPSVGGGWEEGRTPRTVHFHTSPVVRGQGERSSAFETRLIIVGFQDLLI